MPMFSREAVERRLGMQDSRGPQGIMARGANVYRGGMPNAQAGGGNPNIGRPSNMGTAPNPMQPGAQQSGPMAPMDSSSQGMPNGSLTTLVGSLPPNTGNANPAINDAVMNLLQNRFARNSGFA